VHAERSSTHSHYRALTTPTVACAHDLHHATGSIFTRINNVHWQLLINCQASKSINVHWPLLLDYLVLLALLKFIDIK
jgi:hypothetical protein